LITALAIAAAPGGPWSAAGVPAGEEAGVAERVTCGVRVRVGVGRGTADVVGAGVGVSAGLREQPEINASNQTIKRITPLFTFGLLAAPDRWVRLIDIGLNSSTTAAPIVPFHFFNAANHRHRGALAS
jgi:hypothetical protein